MLNAQVSFVVLDEDGVALEGVQVFTDDYVISGLTDEQGRFATDKSVEASTMFNLQYLGFQTMRISWSDIVNVYEHVRMKEGIALDEVMVVGRADDRLQDMIQKVEAISAAEISATQSQNSADLLSQHADIFVQKSQAGGGSPVLRGFEANKVLLVLDGVRMNNAIYRSGHLQNAITVDPAMLSGVEVIYGPGSLMYGSDALGGVIHFRSRDPKLQSSGNGLNIFGNLSTTYATANQRKGIHGDINIGGSKWASLTSLSYNDFGDLQAGSHRPDTYPNFGERLEYVDTDNNDAIVANENPDLQVGTGYQQCDITQKLRYTPHENIDLIANVQYSTTSDVPRYDALIEYRGGSLRYAEWNYGPQQRFLSSVQARIIGDNPFYDQVKLIAAYQRIREDRIKRRLNSDNRNHQEETVGVQTWTADLTKYLTTDQRVRLRYGLEFNHNDVDSYAYRESLASGEKFQDIFTRYPSGASSMTTLGAYAMMDYQLSEAFRLNGGIRYTANQMKVRYDRSDALTWPEEFYNGLETDNDALTLSLGAKYDLKGWTVQAMAGTAFRSPNIDDLAKMRVKSDEVSVPNLSLTPEKSRNAELSISKRWNGLKASVTGFVTYLDDAIVRKDYTTPGGESFIIQEGDTLHVVANVNADKARILGLSTQLDWDISKKYALYGGISWIKGRVKDADEYSEPLAHIPPTYGKLGLKWQEDRWSVDARYIFNALKPIDEYGGSTDNPELATVDGAYAWSTFNLYGSLDINEQWKARVALENILDTHYRPFASGVSGAGRNLILSLAWSF